MQFTSLFTVLATAAIASAAAMPVARPEPITMPHDTPVGAACGQSEEKVACCNGGGSGGNSRFAGFSPFGGACSLNALGDPCSQGSLACCPTQQNNEGFSIISVGSICAPINV